MIMIYDHMRRTLLNVLRWADHDDDNDFDISNLDDNYFVMIRTIIIILNKINILKNLHLIMLVGLNHDHKFDSIHHDHT